MPTPGFGVGRFRVARAAGRGRRRDTVVIPVPRRRRVVDPVDQGGHGLDPLAGAGLAARDVIGRGAQPLGPFPQQGIAAVVGDALVVDVGHQVLSGEQRFGAIGRADAVRGGVFPRGYRAAFHRGRRQRMRCRR